MPSQEVYDVTVPSSQISPAKKLKSHKRPREDEVVHETPRKHKRTKSEHKRSGDSSQLEALSHTPGEPSEKKVNRKYGHPFESGIIDSPAISSKKDMKRGRSKLRESQAAEPAEGVSSQPDCGKPKSEKRIKQHESEAQDFVDVDPPSGAPAPVKEGKRKNKANAFKENGSQEEATISATRKKGKESRRQTSPESSQDAADPDASLQTDTQAEVPDTVFPFFEQVFSLYVPFYPVGFDKPITNVASQHLDPLLNTYSPLLKGVLLDYWDVNLSDRPARASTKTPPTDETPVLLECVDEFAVGFGWLTFTANMFIPSRGSWMEGIVNLQSEGYCGFICWNKFNASVEAKRLPTGWRWVEKDSAEESGLPPPDPASDEANGDGVAVEHIHETGYWVNEHGRRIVGKQRFRIKGFTCGLAGEYGYLSIEGTFLGEEAERLLAAQEREVEQRRRAKQNPNSLLRPLSRRLPEFSMTTFGREQEDDAAQMAVYQISGASA